MPRPWGRKSALSSVSELKRQSAEGRGWRAIAKPEAGDLTKLLALPVQEQPKMGAGAVGRGGHLQGLDQSWEFISSR